MYPDTYLFVHPHRELVCRSLEGRRIDLLTVSSYDGMAREREPRLDKLFPDPSIERAYSFTGKKVGVHLTVL